MASHALLPPPITTNDVCGSTLTSVRARGPITGILVDAIMLEGSFHGTALVDASMMPFDAKSVGGPGVAGVHNTHAPRAFVIKRLAVWPKRVITSWRSRLLSMVRA
eukprot:6254193-Prymnesium_polylepis.1